MTTSNPVTSNLVQVLNAANARRWMVDLAREGYYQGLPSLDGQKMFIQHAGKTHLDLKVVERVLTGEFEPTREEALEWAHDLIAYIRQLEMKYAGIAEIVGINLLHDTSETDQS